MFRNTCRGFAASVLAASVLAASLAGCGGGDVTTNMPSSPQTLSPEMQDFKAQVLKPQEDKVAHHRGSGGGHYGVAPRHR